MRKSSQAAILSLSLVMACALAQEGTNASVPEAASTADAEITFQAADGVRLFADVRPAAEARTAPIAILMHQAGSSGRAEYGPIADELSAAGVNLLIPDLRSGGDLFGGTNRTVENAPGQDYSYCEAYSDVDAAVDAARAQGWDGPLFVWGSSYSAALAVKYAAEHPDKVTGYLAFSPASGEPMGDCQPNPYAGLAANGFVLRPDREASIPSVQEQLDLFTAKGVRTRIVPNGVHGSSMLVDDRTKHDMSDIRAEAISFILTTADTAD